MSPKLSHVLPTQTRADTKSRVQMFLSKWGKLGSKVFCLMDSENSISHSLPFYQGILNVLLVRAALKNWHQYFTASVSKNIPFPVNTGASLSADTNPHFNIGQGDTHRLNVKSEILISSLSHKLAPSFGAMSLTRLQSFFCCFVNRPPILGRIPLKETLFSYQRAVWTPTRCSPYNCHQGWGEGGGCFSPCLLLFIKLLSRLRRQAGVHPSIPSSSSPFRPYEYNQGRNSPLLSVWICCCHISAHHAVINALGLVWAPVICIGFYTACVPLC